MINNWRKDQKAMWLKGGWTAGIDVIFVVFLILNSAHDFNLSFNIPARCTWGSGAIAMLIRPNSRVSFGLERAYIHNFQKVEDKSETVVSKDN